MAQLGSAAIEYDGSGLIQPMVITWRSDANGNVRSLFRVEIDAYAISIVTRPEDGSVPTDLYDIKMIDAFGFDILAGFGANRSDTDQEDQGLDHEWVSHRPVRTRSLRFEVRNAGTSKGGISVIYFTRTPR